MVSGNPGCARCVHPVTRIGKDVFLDHAAMLMVNETAVINGDLSLLQNVPLGGTAKMAGDRPRRWVICSVQANCNGGRWYCFSRNAGRG